MESYHSPNAAFWGGVRAIMPILFGVVPFGLVYGVSATEIGLTAIEGIGMSLLLFAGAAQFVTVELLRTDTAAWIVVGSVAIVNLRFVVYSASLAVHFRPLSSIWKTILSYFVTDEPYALSISYFSAQPNAPHKHWYHLGHGLSLWLVWIASSAAGLLVGAFIPDDLSLEFANSLMFIGLLVPIIKTHPIAIAGLTAGVVALLCASFPHNLGFVIAIVCGIAVGTLGEGMAGRGELRKLLK